MRLVRFVLQGYKRFAEWSSLDTDDHLIALVGPNEVGKTSLLRALRRLNDDDPIDQRDCTLGWEGATELSATFTLDDNDRSPLKVVRGGETPRRLQITKGAGGPRRFDAQPRLSRDVSAREPARRALEAIRGDPALAAEWTDPEAHWDEDRFEQSLNSLDSDSDSLNEEAIENLELVLRSLEGLNYAPSTEDDDAEAVEPSDPSSLGTAIQRLRAAIAGERLEHPQVQAETQLAVVPSHVGQAAGSREAGGW